MTVRTPPGVINSESTDSAVQRDVHRALLGGSLAPFAGGVSAVNNAAHGVCGAGHLEVTQSGTPAMTVDVAAGSAFITGTVSALQGPYNMVNDAAVTLAIADADPSDDRHDLVIAQIRDDDYDSSGFRDARLTVVTGTPDPAPSDPSLSSHPNALVLARVVVQANASSITNSDITNLAPYAGYAGLANSVVEFDTYEPSLSNVTLGTGSPVNSAEYLWIGGTGVGDHGMLMITGQLTLGTGGSFSDTPQFGLPDGFNWADLPSGATGSSFKIGSASFNDSSPATRYFGWTHRPVASVIGVQLMSVSSSNIAAGALSSTAPWTWTTGDSVQYNACYEGVRV